MRSNLQFVHIQYENAAPESENGKPIDLYLGNYDTCNQVTLPEDCIQIHIWHDSQPGVCYKAVIRGEQGIHLYMEYKEHDLLTETQISELTKLTEQNKPIFVHCAAGLGRSPTICVLLLVACGMPPWEAMSVVAEAMWKQYVIPHCPSYDCKVLNQIFSYYDEKNNGQL
jgi:hypothetical protein